MMFSARARTFDITVLVPWVPLPEISIKSCEAPVGALLMTLRHSIDNVVSKIVNVFLNKASCNFILCEFTNCRLYLFVTSTEVESHLRTRSTKVNRCLQGTARAPQPTTNPPTGHQMSRQGLAKMPISGQFWSFLGKKS